MSTDSQPSPENPFPLPRGVDVPLYFTIQPGAAYIKVLADNGSKGARLFYPNTRNAHLGTRFNFWDYDAHQKGWYVYGHGGVSPDGEQIIPDPGVTAATGVPEPLATCSLAGSKFT